ncbi:MAG: 2'-5' RNA ligase family protein [Clostridia bacterium]|nr:2'-5' RNA ligase family protein [Clostridia bacterium]
MYDPLYQLIPPHLTLVFPFESDITLDALKNHMAKVKMKTFEAKIYEFKVVDQYIFAVVSDQESSIKSLHHQLYTGILEPFMNPNYFAEYLPHITIGRFKSHEEALEAFKTLEFKGPYTFMVERLSVEVIQEDDSSLIVYEQFLEATC